MKPRSAKLLVTGLIEIILGDEDFSFEPPRKKKNNTLLIIIFDKFGNLYLSSNLNIVI